jgi:myo-inositol-1(or 4)-monophosphatase
MELELLKGLCQAEYAAISRLSPAAYREVIRIGAGGDQTKMIDQVAEQAAIAFLESKGFKGRLLSEELGEKGFGAQDYPLIVLDPIDGTTNASRGISFYSISAAISSGPRLSDVYAGTVMELPSKRVFSAERGGGAYLDNNKIAVKELQSLHEGIIGIDLNVMGNRQKLGEMIPLCLHVRHMRNMGSAALEMCYVAFGGLDMYADNRGLLRVTDIAASHIVLKEAGATVLNLKGEPLDCELNLKERVSLVAGPMKTCQEALRIMKS